MRNPQAVMKAGVRSRFQGDREKKQDPERQGAEGLEYGYREAA